MASELLWGCSSGGFQQVLYERCVKTCSCGINISESGGVVSFCLNNFTSWNAQATCMCIGARCTLTCLTDLSCADEGALASKCFTLQGLMPCSLNCNHTQNDSSSNYSLQVPSSWCVADITTQTQIGSGSYKLGETNIRKSSSLSESEVITTACVVASISLFVMVYAIISIRRQCKRRNPSSNERCNVDSDNAFVEPEAGPSPGDVVAPNRIGCSAAVMLLDLQASPHLNGRAGVITAFDAERQRYRVTLDADRQAVDVRPANLLQMVAVTSRTVADADALGGHAIYDVIGAESASGKLHLRPSTTAAAPTTVVNPADVIFHPGTCLVLHGLQGESALKWNGQIGTVVSYDEEAGRYLMQVSADAQLKVKPNNVRLFPFC